MQTACTMVKIIQKVVLWAHMFVEVANGFLNNINDSSERCRTLLSSYLVGAPFTLTLIVSHINRLLREIFDPFQILQEKLV